MLPALSDWYKLIRMGAVVKTFMWLFPHATSYDKICVTSKWKTTVSNKQNIPTTYSLIWDTLTSVYPSSKPVCKVVHGEVSLLFNII